VDDNATNRKLLERLLLQWELIPVLAQGGEEAIPMIKESWAQEQKFSAMILDQEMPGLGGIELLELLEKGPALPSPVILMLSRPLESKARLECERLGIARTILKPIRRAWLFEALQQTAGVPKSEPASVKIKGSLLDGDSFRILVAEDNLVNQRLISRLLEKMGHQVLVARDGMAILRILEQHEVDFIAMDRQMPVLDGVETTRKIRAMERNAGGHVPIMAMTANAFEEDRRKCFEAGMDGFVVKPVSAQSIREEMERVLALQVVTEGKDAVVRQNP
jgi:CheY-like chemotaxis protein